MRNMKGVVAVSIALAAVGIAIASEVKPKAGAQPVAGVYTYEVKPEGTEHIKDFHILGKIKGVGGGLPAGWSCSTTSTGTHYWASASGSAEVPAGGNNFTLTAGNNAKDALVTWVTTSSGTADETNGVIDHGPMSGEASTHGPVAMTTPTGGSGAALATATIMGFDSTEYSQSYTAYAMSTATGCPDPWSDNAGFLNFVVSNPVPSGWNLTFSGMTGTVDSAGHCQTPQVTVPNTPVLLGNHFYVVFVVDGDGDCPVGAKVGSEPKEYTISN